MLNKLPPELLELTFKNLNFKDLMGLRTICRRFKNIIDSLKFKELAIKGNTILNFDFYQEIWFHLERKIDSNDIIKLNFENPRELSTFKNQIFNFKLLIHLKRLKLIFNPTIDTDIILKFYITKFINLIQLDLSIDYYTKRDLTINHSNLKIIFINHLAEKIKLQINCPLLEIFHFNLNKFESRSLNCENIKQLFNIYFDSEDEQINLLKFKNLEILHCEVIDRLDFNCILQLTKLREFKINRPITDRNLYERFKEFYIQKQKLERDNLIVILENKKVRNVDKLNKIIR